MATTLNLGKVMVTPGGEHDTSTAYDRLTLVTSGGSSYISKKDVPAGVALTDTAYWQLHGAKGEDGTNGTNGVDGEDAYQPFKGWFDSSSDLSAAYPSPQVGDFAYVKGATSTDPVAIYACSVAGTWADSGNTFNPANNQEFASGEALNTVHIVDGLESSSATDVLSAKQGKVLDQKVADLGLKINGASTDIDTSELASYQYTIAGNGKWEASASGVNSLVLPVESGWNVRITTQTGNQAIYSLLKSLNNMTSSKAADACSGYSARVVMDAGSSVEVKIPSDCQFVVVRGDANLVPSIVVYTDPIDFAEFVKTEEVQEMIDDSMSIDSTSINPMNYEIVTGAINSSGQWNLTKTSKSTYIPVTAGDTLTIKTGESVAIYAMVTEKTPLVEYASASFAESPTTDHPNGWSRYTQDADTTNVIEVPDDAAYLWIFVSSGTNANLLPDSITSANGTKTSIVPVVKSLVSQMKSMEGIVGGSTYFSESDFSPLELRDRPLIYAADDKVNTNHIVNAVAFPNGVIIAARSGGSIVKIALDGTETTLLTCSGSTDWRGLWMDSNLNVYASPFNGVNQDGSATNIGNGIYRMPYGSDTFTKVLSLSAGYCIWTFCEDKDGYIYAGNYQVITNAPKLYRSADNGVTWTEIFDFRTSGLVSKGRHVHSVIYNRYNNALYIIIGEVNEIYKSTDHGVSWSALGVQLVTKGSAMIDTPYGILVGSDGAYFCDIDLVYPDDKTHKRVSRAWADTIFALRQSDVTGNIYAFCKIDSSVKSSSYFPQMADVTDSTALQTWINSSPSQLSEWQEYHSAMADVYPEDAVRPQHFMILMSSDYGKTWRIIYREDAGAINADGFWTIGHFHNGECVAGRVKSTSSSSRSFVQPIIISEGKHKYTSGGIDCNGELFIRTCTSSIVSPL